jgi:YVTN family beta-propeller protein
LVATVGGVGNSPGIDIAITPDGSLLYVANGSTPDNVSVISTATNTTVANWTVGTKSSFLAITPDGAKVYVANEDSGEAAVISTATNAVVATIGVGTSPVDVVIKP